MPRGRVHFAGPLPQRENRAHNSIDEHPGPPGAPSDRANATAQPPAWGELHGETEPSPTNPAPAPASRSSGSSPATSSSSLAPTEPPPTLVTSPSHSATATSSRRPTPAPSFASRLRLCGRSWPCAVWSPPSPRPQPLLQCRPVSRREWWVSPRVERAAPVVIMNQWISTPRTVGGRGGPDRGGISVDDPAGAHPSPPSTTLTGGLGGPTRSAGGGVPGRAALGRRSRRAPRARSERESGRGLTTWRDTSDSPGTRR
jgi:hypothetical protein